MLAGGMNAFVCEMIRSAATAVLLNIMVVVSLVATNVCRLLCVRCGQLPRYPTSLDV